MGLFDKFKTPKWKNKDWKVRLEAVKGLDDQEILVEIAKNDSDSDVRIEALKKITDEKVLYDFAKLHYDFETRRIAINNISNMDLLCGIAKMSPDYEISCHNKNLYNFKSPEKPMNYNGTLKITSELLYSEISILACDKIKDPALLKDIAINSKNHCFRGYPLKYIHDEKDLVEIAIKKSSLRKSAFDKINTKSSFVNLSLNLPDDKDYDTRNICKNLIQNINSEQDLIKIVNSANNKYIRELAAKKVDEINIDNTNDKFSLLEIAKNDNKYEIRKKAIDKLGMDNISDESVLADIAINDGNFDVCKKAIDKINNQNLLSKIALNATNAHTRELAAKKITDKSLIENINELKEKEKLNNQIEELKMDIAYSDSNSGSGCVKLAKLYEQIGDKGEAKRYYNSAINEYQIIIDVCKRENKDYNTWSEKQDEIRGYIRKL